MHWTNMPSFLIILTSLGRGGVTVSDMPSLPKQPLGPLMCKRLCQDIPCCHKVVFNTFTLSCYIGERQDSDRPSRNWSIMFNVKQRDGSQIAETSKRCSMEYIKLKSKTHHVMYIKNSRKQARAATKSTVTELPVFNMSKGTHTSCQKLHKFCESGKAKEALSYLSQLCEETEVNADKTSPKRVGLDRVDKYKKTPIMLAASFGYKTIFDLLMKVGCSLTNIDAQGNTILHSGCRGGNLTIVTTIVKEGSVNIDSRTYNKAWTSLMLEASIGKEDIFRYLVDSGSNLTLVDNDGKNLLHIATFHSCEKLVKYIIDNNIADIESRDNRGRTAAMLAVIAGSTKVFLFLVDRHCNLSVVDTAGNGILHAACKGCRNRITLTFLRHRPDYSGLIRKNKEGEIPIDMIRKTRCPSFYNMMVARTRIMNAK